MPACTRPGSWQQAEHSMRSGWPLTRLCCSRRCARRPAGEGQQAGVFLGARLATSTPEGWCAVGATRGNLQCQQAVLTQAVP